MPVDIRPKYAEKHEPPREEDEDDFKESSTCETGIAETEIVTVTATVKGRSSASMKQQARSQRRRV